MANHTHPEIVAAMVGAVTGIVIGNWVTHKLLKADYKQLETQNIAYERRLQALESQTNLFYTTNNSTNTLETAIEAGAQQ